MKKVVGIVIQDTKVSFAFFEKNFPNHEKIKPVDLAISFHEGKVTPFGEAYNKQTSCFSSLTSCLFLGQKIGQDPNVQKYCTDPYALWVLMMKKIKEHIAGKVEGNLEYVIAIPETNQMHIRDALFLACKANDMKLLRIIPINFCAMMGFQANSYYSRKDGDNYVPKLMLNVNLDDDHTTFTTFIVSREKILKVHSANVRYGQSTFVSMTAMHILQKNGIQAQLTQFIDMWEMKYRKKLGDFYAVINAFSESNVTKTYYRDDDENVTVVNKDDLEQLFSMYINFLAQTATLVVKDTLQILTTLEIPEFMNMKQKGMSGMFFTGEHKNAFVINAIESAVKLTNDSTVNQQQLITEGCGWIAAKMEMKGIADSKQANQTEIMYVYERTVPIESIIAPNTIAIQPTDNSGAILKCYPAQHQLSTEPLDLTELQPGKYNIAMGDYFFTMEGQSTYETPVLGTVAVEQANAKMYVSRSLGFMEGLTSTFEANKENGAVAVEMGCELGKSSAECGPNGTELAPERFSKIPQFDDDLDCIVYVQGTKFDYPVTLYGDNFKNVYHDFDITTYKQIFLKEEEQNKRIEETAKKASDIKTKRSKELIKHVGDDKRKDIIREMNKIIKAHKDDPDELEGAWNQLVFNFTKDPNYKC